MREEKQQQNEKRKSKNYRVKQFKEQNEYLNIFFEDLPKQPSHYVRKNTNKLYLEEHFTSMKQLFDKYSEKCHENDVTPLGRYVFEKTFKEKICVCFRRRRIVVIFVYNMNIKMWQKINGNFTLIKKRKFAKRKKTTLKKLKKRSAFY